AWRDAAPVPFAQLQKRLGRKRPGAAILAQAPVRFLAYDLLERGGRDLREVPLHARREALVELLATAPPEFGLSAPLTDPDWAALAARRDTARALGVEGLMLKDLDSPYGAGRQRGAWWKWKIVPLTFDWVLVYAAAGQGRRSN